MVANLKNLSQAVDRAAKANDRRQGNEITKIQQDIDRQGYSEIEIDGKQFVVKSTSGQK